MSAVHLAPTATKIPAEAAGGVVVSGSHGGAYAAYLVARSGARAGILNDAGIGLDGAGVGCLAYCAALGMAAATVDAASARIGDAAHMLEHGVLSRVNPVARDCGCEPGMRCADAAELLRAAPRPPIGPAPFAEARVVVGENAHGLRIACIDSVSLVNDDDIGQIVVSGSHGGIVAGQPGLAIRVQAAAAVYNDAGLGFEEAGVSRLPALDERGVAAATVSSASARIGDGRSSYADGLVSRVNARAEALGMRVGMTAREALELVTAAP